IADSLVLELIPVEGLVLERVNPEKTLENGTWNGNWSAVVEPGKWILRATSEELDIIAMSLIDVDAIVGGPQGEVELTAGGWLLLGTNWLDYDGISRTLGDTDVDSADIEGEPEVILNIGMGIKWSEQVDQSGTLSLLLPAGTIDTSCEFEVFQRNLTMEYSGGQGVTVRGGQETPLTILSHVRVVNRDIEINTSNASGMDPSHPGNPDDVMLQLNNTSGGYESIEFTWEIEYLGHESFDDYTVVASV
ncbi:uncharacterized protein METZ01_LOCUS469429, partial [marine metagenome]